MSTQQALGNFADTITELGKKYTTATHEIKASDIIDDAWESENEWKVEGDNLDEVTRYMLETLNSDASIIDPLEITGISESDGEVEIAAEGTVRGDQKVDGEYPEVPMELTVWTEVRKG